MSKLNNSNSKTALFFEKIKNNNVLKYLLIAVVAIVVVLTFFYSSNVTLLQESKDKDYVSNLELKLKKCVSDVVGSEDVSVMITLNSSNQTVLAMKTTTNTTEKGVEVVETPILVNGKTVVLMEKTPEIQGVLIVVDKASVVTISRIQQATSSLLNINLSQIEILTKK